MSREEGPRIKSIMHDNLNRARPVKSTGMQTDKKNKKQKKSIVAPPCSPEVNGFIYMFLEHPDCLTSLDDHFSF